MATTTPIENAPQAFPSDQNAALLYLSRLAPASRRTQQTALDGIASLLSDGETRAVDLSWHLLTSEDTHLIRSRLISGYAPTTANRMLAALRGVLKQAWRIGLMDAEKFHRAVSVENVPWYTSQRGRTLDSDEIRALFVACVADPTPAGIRDTALLTVLYGGGLRRSEVAALDIGDYDRSSGALTIRATSSSRSRVVYATDEAAEALQRWINIRGHDAGPLFVPINKGQKILVRTQRLREESIYKALSKRGKQAGVTAFSCQDLRRTFISQLLEAGADVATVQRLAGHCSVATTLRYDRRKEAVQRELARMLPVPVDGWN